MTDLLKPDEVRKQFPFQDIMRLRENYLTLWERNKELEEHHEQFCRRVARDLAGLTQQVQQL